MLSLLLRNAKLYVPVALSPAISLINKKTCTSARYLFRSEENSELKRKNYNCVFVLWNVQGAPKSNPQKNKKAVLSQRWPHDARYISVSDHPLRRYGHLKLSKMAAGRHLVFDVTRNSAIRSDDPENPTLEQNMKCIWPPVAEIWPFAYLGAYGTPHFGEREVIGGQRWHHSKERW